MAPRVDKTATDNALKLTYPDDVVVTLKGKVPAKQRLVALRIRVFFSVCQLNIG